MNVLLTDDEIAGLTALAGAAWPFPLLTIRPDAPEAVNAAVFRGIRTLVVRGLATPQQPQLPTPELLDLIASVQGSTRALLAHVTRIDRIAYQGAAVALFADATHVVADTVSATGIHSFTHISYAEAIDLIVGFAMSLEKGTDELGPTYGVLISGQGAAESLLVTGARLQSGTVVGAPGRAQFVPESDHEHDAAVVEQFVRRGFPPVGNEDH